MFTETPIGGAFVVTPARVEDERGFFARTFDAREFGLAGLEPDVAECSIAYNRERLTLRGMHYQRAPHAEAKLVRCVRGAVYDVIVDLRRESQTYHGWYATELDSTNRRALYVPPGCAHGYLTLEDECELLYQISRPYAPHAAAGVRWDDEAFAIKWPATPRVISPRDAMYPDVPPRRQ
jgi:dTDP-4-dehydrorhamnose 3,5-epimerase